MASGAAIASKGVAWVIDVGVNKRAWLARYKDQCCGPSSLKEAKAAAVTMAKGLGDRRRGPRQALMPRHHGFRFGALIPALVVGGLKRLHDRAVKAGHIHDSVIGTDIAL